MSILINDLIARHNENVFNLVARASAPKANVREICEFVRGVECVIEYDFERGTPATSEYPIPEPATVELVSVKTLGGDDLLLTLDREEEAMLKRECLREAIREEDYRDSYRCR